MLSCLLSRWGRATKWKKRNIEYALDNRMDYIKREERSCSKKEISLQRRSVKERITSKMFVKAIVNVGDWLVCRNYLRHSSGRMRLVIEGKFIYRWSHIPKDTCSCDWPRTRARHHVLLWLLKADCRRVERWKLSEWVAEERRKRLPGPSTAPLFTIENEYHRRLFT